MVAGNALWVMLWLAVGVVGLVGGLVWLRSVERGHRAAPVRPVELAELVTLDAREPDALAG